MNVPRDYRFYDCPGPCKAGEAKYAIYEIEGEEDWIAELIRLCRKCRKEFHVEEHAIVEGPTIDKPTTRALGLRPSRPRNLASGAGINSR